MFPDFLKYVPDEWAGGPRADRSFFYTVLQTLAPEYINALLEECRELRAQRKVKASLGADLTNIQAQFLGPLLQGPFVSDCKCLQRSFLSLIFFLTYLFLPAKQRGPSIVVNRLLKDRSKMKKPAPIVPKVDPTKFFKRQRREPSRGGQARGLRQWQLRRQHGGRQCPLRR